jgi:hypothetical protein
MARPKGQPKLGGRQKGTPNKITATVKQAIEQAFNEVGGSTYLVEMAHQQPKAFMTLLGKVIPQQIDANVTAALLPGSVDDFVIERGKDA